MEPKYDQRRRFDAATHAEEWTRLSHLDVLLLVSGVPDQNLLSKEGQAALQAVSQNLLAHSRVSARIMAGARQGQILTVTERDL